MSKVIRSVKNVTKGYSTVQVRVRDATSNDPWGPTGTQMSEISQMTYNSSNEFYEIMDMLDKRLNDKGKNWRHVLKALKVLDYCLHEGSELVVTWARKNVYIIKTLREFQYIDEDGRDVGQNVRVSAKELTSLIIDEDRLRSERSDRKLWKSRVTGIEEGGRSESPRPRRERGHRAQRSDEEDAEYRLAIEASKYQEEEDRKRREGKSGGIAAAPDDEDLAKAIKLSQEEEELRRRELENQNAASLFDDDPIQTMQPQYTNFNQGYQQQSAVDWSGNPIDQNSMQQQQTGFLNPNYTNQGFQAQPTGYQNGFGQQNTGLDPYGQQSLYGQPTGFQQPQPTGYNPYAQQQQTGFGQPQQQQEPVVQAGTNNPWATNSQPMAQPQKPMPTGSNNPFASSFSRPQTAHVTSQPTLRPLQEQKTASQFSTPSFNSFQSSPAPAPQKQVSEHEARLNALLSSGDGMDTFGNTGNLRIPAQHTAPGTFVNSAAHGLGRINEQATGTNPFLQSQSTGMPQTQYSQGGFGGANHQMPAATGPAGTANGLSYGQQNSNPFGQRQQQGGQGGGDLIQF